MPLGRPRRVWAMAAIHAESGRLIRMHDALYEYFRPGDRVVYLSNYTGYGRQAAVCMDEILTFRKMLLALPGVFSDDVVYLRGQQEEMWQKLLQLQFAPDPANVLLWMLENGLAPTLKSYGVSPHDGIEACGHGVMGLAKWTNAIRVAMRRHPGHEALGTHLNRAAHTCEEDDYPMLFVHGGLNARKTLAEQGDSLWWRTHAFAQIDQPYLPFQKVVRGYDPERKGLHLNCITASIDDGCGFGGTLVSVGFEADGSVAKVLET